VSSACDERETLTRVPVDPFRERFLELEAKGAVSRTGLARALGWYRNAPPSKAGSRGGKVDDVGRVNEVLGLKRTPRRTIAYEIGVQLCTVLNMEPHEAGV
jgi:hypothetical protein